MKFGNIKNNVNNLDLPKCRTEIKQFEIVRQELLTKQTCQISLVLS